MILKFTPQPYQDAAVAAVVGLFHGEGDILRRYIRGSMLTDSVGNELPIGADRIGQNLHAVQRENRLPLTGDAANLSFCVEMETGTGKTYVYIKTIYELHALYGLSKFVVVVPSIAIREGVKKSFEMTHEHFQTQYDRQPIRWFVYNSARLGDVKEFAQSTGIEVMIINIDAFRKSENIIHQQMDRMNSGRAIDLIRDVCPIVIIDEPQSVDNTPKAKEAISWLHPLFTLRYSATHINEKRRNAKRVCGCADAPGNATYTYRNGFRFLVLLPNAQWGQLYQYWFFAMRRGYWDRISFRRVICFP